MDEPTIRSWIDSAKLRLQKGDNLDDILTEIRAEGGSQIDTIKVLRGALGMGLKEAKQTVHFSPAWADAKDRQERFWAELTGDCQHCGHPIGYHHLDDDKCSCKDCPCPGFEGRSKRHE